MRSIWGRIVRGNHVDPHDCGQVERKSGGLVGRRCGSHADQSWELRWIRRGSAECEENNHTPTHTPAHREGCERQGDTEPTLEHRLASSHAECHAVRVTDFHIAGPAGGLANPPLEESSSSAYHGGRGACSVDIATCQPDPSLTPSEHVCFNINTHNVLLDQLEAA